MRSDWHFISVLANGSSLTSIVFWHVLPSTSPQIPLEMVIPPGGIDLLTSYTMPYSQEAIDWMSSCLCISTLCAMLGFFSRTSACLCALLGTYVLGVQELFGKVSRFHQHIDLVLSCICSESLRRCILFLNFCSAARLSVRVNLERQRERDPGEA